MSSRFADLKKVPNQPARRALAMVHAKLSTPIDAPASASVEVVLEELAQKNAWVDVLRLLSIVLPAREAVWWSCIAARDIVGQGEQNATHCLRAAEAWVFKPTSENREAARVSLDNVYIDDDTALCATAALYAPGDMGPGDMANYPAPAGAVSSCAFGMNMISLAAADDFDGQLQLLIDRALDIGRGGNGQVKRTTEAAKAGDE